MSEIIVFLTVIQSALGIFGQVIFGAIITIFVCTILAMIILPIYASMGIFVNKPEGMNRSGIHFFTRLSPGEVKIIDRDGKLARMIMDVGGKKFARTGGDENRASFWQIVPNSSNGPENPVADVWLPLRWWAKIVYNLTGAVFIGIYPFVRVREYTLERTVVKRSETKTQAGEGSNLQLSVKEDLSDHFRAREFLFPMHFVAAETADKIPLDIVGVAEMEVINPYEAAYGTDRWDYKITNLVSDAATTATKGMTLDQALTAVNPADVRRIQIAIESIGSATGCGLRILGFRILEINPVLSAEGLSAIQAEALAIQRAKATVIDGTARGKALTEINKANQAGGEHSIATMQTEGLVRAAEAAARNGGSVILMPGSSNQTDATQAAILAELKKLNKS